MTFIPVLLIKIYQVLLSPLFPNSCRFYPTCSNYCLEAFEKYGLFKGIYLGTKRILKCNPLFEGGIDPVPLEKSCSHNSK